MLLKGCIYKMINITNNKVYIGQTRQRNPKARFWQHFYESEISFRSRNTYLSSAIRKYGKENFTFEILIELQSNSKESLCVLLDVLEKFYIEKHKSNNYQYGYNLTNGGQLEYYTIKNHPKRILVDRNKIKYNKTPFTEERLKRMSEITTAYFQTHEHVKKGIPATKEYSDKASQMELSEESKQKRKLSKQVGQRPENIQKSKKLQQYVYYMLDSEDNVIQEFRSLQEASRYINRDDKSIRKCISGQRLTCAGYKWKREKL